MAGRQGGRYRATLRDPIAARIFMADTVSMVGDYVGFGALLVLAYERTGGRVIGPAALFAVKALPALLSGTFAGSWLDQVPRRTALATLQALGALALLMPLFLPGLAPILVAAGCLGALRAAHISVRSGALAEAVPEELRGGLLALLGSADQFGQVLGYLTGAAVALSVGAAPAIVADAATFVIAAVVLAFMPFPPPRPRDRRPPPTAGFTTILRHPVLRLLAPLVWVTALVGALPETLAPGVTADDQAWTPFVLAAAPAGQAITMVVLGRYRTIERPSFQLVHMAWFALAFGVAALGRTPAFFVVGNLLVGSGTAWLLGPQTLFVRVAPTERMAQVTGSMIAAIIACEGLGTLAFAALADATSVGTAYRAAGYLILATAIVGWIAMERVPEARALEQDDTMSAALTPIWHARREPDEEPA